VVPFDMNSDFHFIIPTLHPELFEMLEEKANENTSEEGFIISLGESKYHFLCSSRDEFLGWIQGCRRSIEVAWVMYTRGDKVEEDRVTLDNFKVKVDIKIKPDGQTNIIEIAEDVTYQGRHQALRSSESIRSNQDLLDATLHEGDYEDESRETPENESNEGFSCSIKFESISLSLMDLEPVEILYLSLKDIDVSIERDSERLRVAGTIQGIQISNQLLNPAFQVMLFQRKSKNVFRKLMLPGLHQQNDTFPTLHIFFQQKFFKHNEVDKKESDDNLVVISSTNNIKTVASIVDSDD